MRVSECIISKVMQHLSTLCFSRKLFGVCTIVVSILCIPTMLVHRIVKMPLKILPLVSEPATLIAKELYTLDMVEDACSLFQLNLWLTAIFLKVGSYNFSLHASVLIDKLFYP